MVLRGSTLLPDSLVNPNSRERSLPFFGNRCLALGTCIGLARIGSSALSYVTDPASVKYGATQVIAADDSDSAIAEKAAKVLPQLNQSAWMRLEQTYFIHYGPNTFRGVELGNGHEDPAIFYPTALNADQWIQSFRMPGAQPIF